MSEIRILGKYRKYWNAAAIDLTAQGEFALLLAEENNDITWQAYKYSVPRGVMGFAARAATNSLATADNLFRWSKRVDSSCKVCKSSNCTLKHILSFCSSRLNAGAYTWRHNYVLSFISDHVISTDNVKVYYDLEGKGINGGTIPASYVTTSSKPDICIIDVTTTPHTVHLFELTVPFESNVSKANLYKQNQYSSLESDIKDNGFKCVVNCFEIGARGYINTQNKMILGSILKLTKSKINFPKFYQNISKISLLCSYSIYNARNEETWTSPNYIKPFP